MTFLNKTLHDLVFAPALALLCTSACTDDGGNGDTADGSDTSGTDVGTESAEGNDSSTEGDGDGDSGDGDGDTGDGDGDTGDGDGDTGDGDGDTGDGDGDTGDGDGDTGDGDGDTGDGDGDTGGGDCAAMAAEAIGDCEAILGAAWDGVACHQLVGCECVGEDCGELFNSLDQCEAAYADCGNNGDCAELGFEACAAAENCNPIEGAELEQAGDNDWCALAPIYLGCSSEQICGDAISFACPNGDDVLYQTLDTCLPDVGYSACQPPNNQAFYEFCP
ncbi:hypothetical protein ENSA5_18210 [Enhygromyxa salina]|uniref:Endo-1,4-beta-xylanase A n=1 Tax=Enhygromyxa salina TaxID=215803 RepID=A0A2S9YD53_9BACT|nr:hypothetical protein [Enhygromyxa salina]PRQ03050.1 hypothetical protein ENSA5_18210 [Enhygromyxa salina]